jgi:hypothetical protein
MNMFSRRHDEIKPPGGKIGYDDLPADSPYKQNFQAWEQAYKESGLGEKIPGYSSFRDPDFIAAFIQAVPDMHEQILFVINTDRYLFSPREADPKYVLLFRRTLPSSHEKPEEHWSSEYSTARMGLRREIAGAQRLHSVLLCDTIAHLQEITGGFSENPNDAQSDGEIKFKATPIDQKSLRLVFRPADQEKELQQYLQQPDALSLDQVQQLVTQSKTKRSPIAGAPSTNDF